jgi:hypothetical protein
LIFGLYRGGVSVDEVLCSMGFSCIEFIFIKNKEQIKNNEQCFDVISSLVWYILTSKITFFNVKRIMNYSTQKARNFPAFVIKNYLPISQKIEIVHFEYGKILCIYPKNHQAALLSSGSLIFCAVEKSQNVYRFLDLSIEKSAHGLSMEQLVFVHDMMRLCQKSIPREIRVPELFDFLLYVYRNLLTLSQAGRSVAMLRLFLLFDLLPEQQEVYQIAIQDPCGAIPQDAKFLNECLQRSWDNFYQHDTA